MSPRPLRCHAVGCAMPVAEQLFMCSAHWRVVPVPMQAAVRDRYRPGPEQDRNPSPAWLAAAWEAIATVAEHDVEAGYLPVGAADAARRWAELCRGVCVDSTKATSA